MLILLRDPSFNSIHVNLSREASLLLPSSHIPEPESCTHHKRGEGHISDSLIKDSSSRSLLMKTDVYVITTEWRGESFIFCVTEHNDNDNNDDDNDGDHQQHHHRIYFRMVHH